MLKLLISALIIIFNSSLVFAAGFTGQTTKYSIQDALKQPDDSYLTIQGNIIRKLSSEKYLFKDTTGTITVEIDNEKWGNIEASEKDILELTGEIEKKFNSIHFDVDTITKINK